MAYQSFKYGHGNAKKVENIFFVALVRRFLETSCKRQHVLCIKLMYLDYQQGFTAHFYKKSPKNYKKKQNKKELVFNRINPLARASGFVNFTNFFS